MSTICTSTLFGRLVDLDMLDNEVAGVQTLGVGVRFRILEEREEILGGLDGPAGTGDAELLAYGCASSAMFLIQPLPAILMTYCRL